MTVLMLPAAPRPDRARAMLFEDPVSKALLDRIQQLAPSRASVLITGETGTGKEIVARHIHELSLFSQGPFLAVNCGAFPESLAESELFGHERGAFTGAVASKAGWFEEANGGTLFLDEIADLSPALQVKLLRVLQQREVVRLGASRPIPIDVRLIAATNADLVAAVEQGRFRADLYYRLNVASVNIRPLRERRGDILPLARYFLEFYGGHAGFPPIGLAAAAERCLLEYSWPGNIRELENAIHRAVVLCREGPISPGDLSLAAERVVPYSTSVPRPEAGEALEAALLGLFEGDVPKLYALIERAVVRAAFHYCERNQLKTARLLGISRNIVRARLIQFGEIGGPARTGCAQD